MMLIDNEFNIGDFVYLKTDEEQLRRLVTNIVIKPCGAIDYVVTVGASSYQAYSMELSIEKCYENS